EIRNDADGRLEVVLENELLLARYAVGKGGRKGEEWAIRDLVIKAADEDQAGAFIDASATRGFLSEASVIAEAPGVKTVGLTFDDGNRQDVTIWAGKPYLRIDYHAYGVNVVDIGSPGGAEGAYSIHGGDAWHRQAVNHPSSYYNRYPKDVGTENVEAADPADAGPLAYREHFIMAVVNGENGRGFGRVVPVRHVSIIKLLWNKGFELFPHFGEHRYPYTGWLFIVDDGADGAMARGRRIVDEEILPGEGVGGPRPGDVYREYVWAKRFHVLDTEATNPGAADLPRSDVPRVVRVDDLEGAVRAEVSVQYWGGHIGTGGQRFRVNGHDWVDIPQPAGTPTEPQCYYRTVMGDNAAPIPLEWLKEGDNELLFVAGPQIRYNFGWGFYWVYSFTVRVYYGPDKPHVAARIASPAPMTALGDRVEIELQRSGGEGEVAGADVIAFYEDFDWEGNGLHRQWHYQYARGELARHVGSADSLPGRVVWDTTWVADQDRAIRLAARVVGADGIISLSPAVDNLRLGREGRSVRMIRATDVPENFGVRVGHRKQCTLDIPFDPAGVTEARLVLSTWSAAHAEEIAFNGTRLVENVGVVHNVSFDTLAVPVELLRQGPNALSIYSSTEHHAAEINWPGPVLLLETR
ncbi:MAG: hypothetical protein GX591_07565, partial [Planctomycetes bacterium]|nr:hypothetical protein [Planctomycetota bacterium]